MPVTAFLKLCRCTKLMPADVTIEDLNQFVLDIYSPMTLAEHKWMVEQQRLFEVYKSDVNYMESPIERQPKIQPELFFHEFIFLLATIATRKNTSSAKVHNKIENFFIEKLNFKQVEDDDK